MKILDRINKDLPIMSKHDFKEVLKTLITINKFKIEEEVISKMIEVLGFLLDRNRGLDNKKKLYVLYDSLILSIFDSLEDLHKKTKKELMSNTDIQKKENICHEKIEQLVVLIETSLEDMDYSHSFLVNQNDEYIGLDTSSFIIFEYPLNQSEFRISNPNIDTSYDVEDPTNVEFIASDGHPNSKYNIQMIVFSSALFSFEFNNYQLLVNPLYIKILDPNNQHKQISNVDALLNGVKIEFPMLYLPGFENIKNHLMCKTFKTGQYENSQLNGKVVDFNEDMKTVTCEFEKIGSFSNTYFGVFILKRDDLE